MSDVKGGIQARRAAMLCQNPRFGLYLDQRRRQANALEWRQLPDGTHSADDCADWLRQACGIKSRAELDHNEQALAMLERIVVDFNKWQRLEMINNQLGRATA